MPITVADLVCHDGTPYPAEQWLDRLETLLSLANKINDVYPVRVVSGYRTEAYNERLAGRSQAHQVASGSQHVQGMAVDLRPVTGTPQELAQTVLALFGFGELPELGGIGVYPKSNWVHVDTMHAADGHLRRWNGT